MATEHGRRPALAGVPGVSEREVMDAREAADFLRISYDLFKRMAGQGKLPRHAVTERNYVYLRSELLEWLRSRPADGLLLDR